MTIESDKWFLFKINMHLKWIIFINKIQRWRHCRKGFHNFASGSLLSINHKGQKLESNYITCRTCETYFFPTAKDKDNYIRMKEQDRSRIQKWLTKQVPKDVKVKVDGKIKVKEFKNERRN